MTCELVTSGWYSTTEQRNYRTDGDELIRGTAFRPLWWDSINTFLKPQHVLIVDSASPVKPDDAKHTSTDVRHLELLMNPGHAQNGKTFYCGAMAAIMTGMEYALFNDVDFMIYVEQDALIYGKRVIEMTKDALRRKPLVFGSTRSKLGIQQSFFAASKNGIRKFLSALYAIDFTDNQMAPEHKFMYAGSRFLPSPILRLGVHTPNNFFYRIGIRLFSTACNLSRDFEYLPFGYGRERPINFDDDVFYFQHGSAEELSKYRQKTNF